MAMPKSQLNPKVKRLFTGTEVGALLEDVDQKLGMIVDGQNGLGERMDTLEVGMNGLEKRMTRLEVKVDTLEVKVDTLTETVGEMKMELTDVNDKLDRKADRSEVTILDSRVSDLEVK
jgi:uncharacterized coiled-coil protein SlyX